jgi:DNA-binding MarR family transcriptional regulator
MLKASATRRGLRKLHTRKFDSLEQEAFLNLWRTYDRLKAIEDETFLRHDLTAQQYNALRLLRAAAPGPTSKGTVPTLVVAERLISKAPDITRLLDRLESRSLVRRERKAENRRVVEVGLTDEGRVLLDLMAAEVRECARKQLGHLSDRELRTLIALLHKARSPHEMEEGAWSVGSPSKNG